MDILTELSDNVCYLAVYCWCVYLSYLFIYAVLDNNSLLFNKLQTSNQMYVVKNISKSIVLAYISYDLCLLLYKFLCYNYILDNSIKKIASIYVSNDMVALIFVSKLSKATRRHHLTTTFLLFMNYFIDYTDNSSVYTKIGMLLIGYTTLSAFAFSVNLFLGSRFIISDKTNRMTLNYIAYYNYIICLAINWVTQLLFISYTIWSNLNLIPIYLMYSIIFIPIIKDDLVLISWLQKTIKENI